MADWHGIDQFYSFMQEYVAFVEGMAQAENERLRALTGWNLEKLEKSIAVSQANAMRLENMEKRRLEVQQAAGLGSKSFALILEELPEEWKPRLEGLMHRFEGAVGEIRHNNDKAMAVAKDNMMRIDPESVLPGGQKANPYNKIGRGAGPVFKADI